MQLIIKVCNFQQKLSSKVLWKADEHDNVEESREDDEACLLKTMEASFADYKHACHTLYDIQIKFDIYVQGRNYSYTL